MNNIFLKSAKKSLLWKTLNVLVVFSLVSSYTVPLIPVVRAEDGAEVSASDSPAESTPDTSTESGDESQSDEDRGNTGTDEENRVDEASDDTATEEETLDDTPEEEVSEEGGSSNPDEESSSEETPSEEVLGTSSTEQTEPNDNSSNNSPETGEEIRVPKTFESGDEEAYYENSRIADAVKCDDSKEGCTPVPQTGSIRVCKITVDEEGNLNTENIVDGATFTIEGNSASTLQFGAPSGTISPSAVFATPISVDADLFGNDQVPDAECITYSELSLSNPGYYYKAETISPSEGWDAPLYNDQYGISYILPEGAEFDMEDFHSFSDELFDENGTNDEERNQKSDGHITLSVGRPDRTIVVVNRYEAPENQCEEASFSVVSDATATVVENANANAVATWVHPNWTASIPGATWIWETFSVLNTTQNVTKTFEKTFNVDGVVLDADLVVAADNQYEVWINGNLVKQDATEDNYSLAGQDTEDNINPAFFEDGTNTIKMIVTNMGVADSNSESNPAGALFKLDLKTEDCGGGNQCSEKIMARVVVTDVQNVGVGGNITSDVYVGGNTNAHKYASGEWFEVYDGTNWITDPNIATFHNVPGLAIRRMDGKIQIRDIGPFIYSTPKPQEHIEGYIEFQNASALSQENDTIAPVEYFSNGVKLIKDTEDEIWIDGGKSYFWMTTSTGNDGFYTNISEPVVDDCTNPEPYCGDGNIDQQLGEQCDGGENCTIQCTIIVDDENPICNPEINLISNGGFEDVAVASGWNTVNSGTPGLGWVVDWVVGGLLYEEDTTPLIASLELHRGVNGWLPSEGDQYAELDGDWEGPTGNTSNEPASTKISQTIPTVIGRAYTISVDYSGRPGTDGMQNQLGFSIDGTLIPPGGEPEDNSSGTQTDWRTVTRTFTATAVSTTVSLEDMGTNDSVGTFVDNVSVSCTNAVSTCGDGYVDIGIGEECELGAEGCTAQCTMVVGQGGPEDDTQCSDGIDNDNDGQIDFPDDLGCTDLLDDDESNGGGNNPENNGGGSGGGSSSGSRPSSSSSDGEVLGANTTDGEVLGDALAQTGVDFSPISFFALIALSLFVIARRKEDKKLA